MFSDNISRMCGKCIILEYDEVLDLVHEIEIGIPFDFSPDWPVRLIEAYPNSIAPLIVPEFDLDSSASGFKRGAALGQGSLAVREFSWGFKEDWKPGVVFNTRIESAMRPIWRDSMERRRCIIPVHAFFETHRGEMHPSPKTGKPVKRRYEFRVPGQDVILIGCIWRDGSFSMVTTEANGDMAPIHHRMPLIVRQEELPVWFGPEYQSLADRSSVRLEAKPVFPAQSVTQLSLL